LNKEEMRYEFGANWADYIKTQFSEDRLEISRKHLLGFLKLQNLDGMTFLDIGCGSGMHSLAALRSGASRIVSIDYDQDSVDITKYLHQYAGSPQNWEIYQGSILDHKLISSIGTFDIVYSWGVLHHTGEMWAAIKNASIPIAPEGIFYIALYTTDVYINPPPEYWLGIKQKYNRSGYLTRKLMEFSYAYDLYKGSGDNVLGHLNNIRKYKQSRGMSYWTDIKDWLGGWPMEFAGISETKEFCKNELNLELLNIIAGHGNIEYLFRKEGAKNYWDEYMSKKNVEVLQAPFRDSGGYAWEVDLPQLKDFTDIVQNSTKSSMMLYEDGQPIGFAHVPLQHIQTYGKSRYSHLNDKLYFSTTDNTDPNVNKKIYSYAMNIVDA
jgi:SAM-dependent methyltransferase